MKTKLLVFIILIGGIFSMSFIKFGSMLNFAEIDIERSFAIDNVDEISVNMSSESIHIYQDETNSEIKFHLYGNTWPQRNLSAVKTNGKVSVNKDRSYYLGNLTLDIYLPMDYRNTLVIETSSGAITVVTVELSHLSLNSTSGDISCDTVKTSASFIKSRAGHISIMQIESDNLEMKSDSGKITTSECHAEKIRMETTSGDIISKRVLGNIELKSTAGKVMASLPEFTDQALTIESTSGSVSLELPTMAGFTIDAVSNSGKVQSDFTTAAGGEMKKNSLTGKIGSGIGQIRIKTTSGNIMIGKME